MSSKEWKEVTLGDVCILNYGKALTAKNRIAGNVPVYSSAGITGWHNKALVDSEGIIVGRKGSVGTVYYSDSPFFCIDTAYYILPSKDYNLKYLFYRLKSLGLENLNEDSAVPGLNRDTAYTQRFLLPSYKEQSEIAAFLSCIDNKIDLNNKINDNLQQQAQALFKSWFIDFIPFQNGIFHDTVLGRIPQNWSVGCLSQIADITMGQSPSGSSYNEDGNGTVFFQGRAEFGFRFPTRRLFTTEPKRIAQSKDVLMSVRAPVGDLNVAYEDCCIGRGLAAIHSNDNHHSFVLYTMFALKSQLDVFNGEGTVFGSINKDALNKMPILIPPTSVLDKFESLISPMDSLIRTNYEEICNLQAVRDSLLPRLMSGEINVSDTTI